MRKQLMGMLAIASIVVGACGSSAATNSPGASPTAAAPTPSPTQSVSTQLFNTTYTSRVKTGTAGGTVIVADWQQVDTLNYYYAGAQTDIDVIAAFSNGLTNVTDDFKYVPDMAASIPTVDNGGVQVPGANGDAMTVTWKLRDNLKWSDGTAITCSDVQYTWQWNMDPANTGLYGGTVGWEDIKGIDCPDPQTIVIHWKNVYEGYLSLISAVLPKEYMSQIAVKDAPQKSYPLTNDISKVPVSGPFMPTTIAKDLSEIDLVPNPNYTSPAWDGSHKPYLANLKFKYYGDAATMIAGYKSGEFDIAKDLNDGDLPSLKDLQAQNQVVSLTGLTYEFLRPNWESKVMGDIAMRQALDYAVDKNAINTRILGGNAQITNIDVGNQTFYYDKSVEALSHQQDLAKANSILDAAGWVKGSDGVRSKGGVRAAITMCTTTKQTRLDTLALVAGWLKQIGVSATVKGVAASQIFASYNDATDKTACNLAHGTYDVAEHAFVVPIDPLSNYVTYYSKDTEPNGSNDAHVNDPVIDQALDQLKGTVDPKVIIQAMSAFQQEYIKAVVEVPLYYRKEVYIVSPKVQNFTGNPTTAGPAWNVQDWFLTQ